MIISLKDLKDQCDSKNLNWLNSINVKNRIKDVIKNNKLPEEVVEFLWQRRELRWDITRYQKLSKNLMFFVIDNYKSPREISKSIYKEMLIRQDINDDIIDYIYNKYLQGSSNYEYFDAWKNIPNRMKSKLGVDSIFGDLEFKECYYDKCYIETIVTIVKDRFFLKEMLDFVLDKNYCENFNNNPTFLQMLASSSYFDDVSMDKMNKILDPESFKIWAKLVISRNNCSQASKALLLLFN